MQKYIAHLDMDAFFAAVEQRDNPSLKNKPVIIGADPKSGKGRGVVSTCSYEARKFGIYSSLPISIAYKRCPKAIFLRPDIVKYQEVSEEIYELLYQFTPKIEIISIDEAFLDISGTYHLFKTPLNTCRLLKEKIKEKTRLTASIGLAPIMMAAKIASDLDKPDGLVEVTSDNLLNFLWPLDIGKIWGLGAKSKESLNTIGVKTIGDLAELNPKTLTDLFGKNGYHLWQLANGIDDRQVEPEEEVKSIGNEYTFEKDTDDKEKIERRLITLCEKVSYRLRRDNLKAKTITLKIRLQGFSTYTRSKTITKASNFVESIYKISKNLLDNFNTRGKKVRLIGVKTSGLMPSDIKDTFFIDEKDQKKENLHKATDLIKEKFGRNSIHRAKMIKSKNNRLKSLN